MGGGPDFEQVRRLVRCTHPLFLRLLRTGGDAFSLLGPPPLSTHSRSVDGNRFLPKESEHTVSVETLRKIAGGHVGQEGAGRKAARSLATVRKYGNCTVQRVGGARRDR